MENKLFYKKEAEVFEQALPLGNGSFGAMVYGRKEKEKLSLNLDTLWSGKKTFFDSDTALEAFKEARELVLKGDVASAEEIYHTKFYNMWSAYYLPMANLYIERENFSDENYYRELSLENSIAFTKFGKTENESFISFPHKVLIFRETSKEKENLKISLDSLLKYSVKFENNALILSGRCPSKGGHKWDSSGETPFIYEENDGITFTLALKVVTDGEISFDGDILSINNANSFTLFASALSSFVSFDKPYDENHKNKCLEILNKAINEGYEKIKEEHIKDFSSLYNLTSLDLKSEKSALTTDERLKSENKKKDFGLVALLWNYGKYLTLTSSREGSEATNLQGIWNEHLYAPWRSNYTVNINTEMNYWPTLMLGLNNCYLPLIDLVKKISVTGRETAKNYYGAEGFCSHHNVDLWGHSTPVGGRNNPGAKAYAGWNLSSGWLSAQIFDYYEYTKDVNFIKDTAYGILKEASKFYLSLLVKDNGEYILAPTSSPENCYIGDDNKEHSLTKKAAMTQAIIKELFIDTLKAAEILNVDKEFCEVLKEKIENIHPHIIGSDGRILEWDKEYKECDLTHRHVSHLYGLFPGNQITTEKTPELTEAVKESLKIRGDAGTGWSLGWKINLWAKLKDGDHTLKLVYDQLNFVSSNETNYSGGGGTYSNMMDAHPPFQIDGNFGATAGITQMFLQYECGKIKILPALPSAFKQGEIKGIKTKGNITVSIIWEENKAKKITLLSPFAQSVKVETEGKVYGIDLNENEITALNFPSP